MSATATATTVAETEHGLAHEYEHEPVPIHHRRSLRSVSAVWFGFPMILTNAIFGGTIVYGLGFWKGLTAIIVGNLVLLTYVGALSYVAGRSGENFGLTAARTFGRRGATVAAGFLSTVVIGWFAFQTGLTGATLHAALGWNQTLTILAAGLLYIGIHLRRDPRTHRHWDHRRTDVCRPRGGGAVVRRPRRRTRRRHLLHRRR